jgi:hypothetical protein
MDSLSLAYLPIVQPLEAYASSADTAELRGDLGSSASAVARIAQIRQRLSVDFGPAGDPMIHQPMNSSARAIAAL